MRKVKDYYFNKAKKEKYPARSVYKLEEAQKKYSLLRRGDRILDIGCMPGSWSLYAAEIAGPSGLVVGIDLQVKGPAPPPRSGSAPIHWRRGDIMEEETIAGLKEQYPAFSVLLSDMAPKTTGNRWTDQQQSLRLTRRVLQVSGELLAEGGHFYCKVFQGEDFEEFVAAVKECFATVRTVKPKSSRSESREIFILGLQYQAARAVSTV